jgi:hypothetical protein
MLHGKPYHVYIRVVIKDGHGIKTSYTDVTDEQTWYTCF